GTASTLSALFYTNDRTGHIDQNVNPGVFIYFSFVTAPAAGTFTVKVVETPPSNSSGRFLVVNTATGNLSLWNATGTTPVANGTTGSGATGGNVSFTATASQAGQMFIVYVKYDSKSIVGAPVPSPGTTAHYTWTTTLTQGTTTTTEGSAGLDLRL